MLHFLNKKKFETGVTRKICWQNRFVYFDSCTYFGKLDTGFSLIVLKCNNFIHHFLFIPSEKTFRSQINVDTLNGLLALINKNNKTRENYAKHFLIYPDFTFVKLTPNLNCRHLKR